MRIRLLTPARVGVFVLALAFCATVAVGQMPTPDSMQTLSSSDVSDQQVQKVARIAVATQMSVRKDRMKFRRDMKKKYGNPQEMDSTQKAKARREARKKQMAMRKKQSKVMQQEAKKEGLDPMRVQSVLRSARQDSTLKKRLQTAMKAEMKKQQSKMGGGKMQGGGKKGGGSMNQ